MIECPDPVNLRHGGPRVQVCDRTEQMNRSVNAAIGSDSKLVRGGGMLDLVVELNEFKRAALVMRPRRK